MHNGISYYFYKRVIHIRYKKYNNNEATVLCAYVITLELFLFFTFNANFPLQHYHSCSDADILMFTTIIFKVFESSEKTPWFNR